MSAFALWRRLDTPGHDAASILPLPDGWRLHGTAVFVHDSLPARLDYELELDSAWRTRWGVVTGFLGNRQVDDTITHSARGWTFNGRHVAGLDALVDLDLAFTPATNLQQIRRLDLAIGQRAAAPAAWLAPGADTLVELPQYYRRDGELTYTYEAPTVPYQATLELAPNGFVRSYPGLWVLESSSG